MLKLKGKEYKFRFGLKALLMFEELTGKSATNLGNDVMISTVIDLAYCAIKSTGEDITKDVIIDACDEDMGLLNEISELLSGDLASVGALGNEAKK